MDLWKKKLSFPSSLFPHLILFSLQYVTSPPKEMPYSLGGGQYPPREAPGHLFRNFFILSLRIQRMWSPPPNPTRFP